MKPFDEVEPIVAMVGNGVGVMIFGGDESDAVNGHWNQQQPHCLALFGWGRDVLQFFWFEDRAEETTQLKQHSIRLDYHTFS